MSKTKSQTRTRKVNTVVKEPVPAFETTEKVAETFDTPTPPVSKPKVKKPKAKKAKKTSYSVTYKGLIKTLKEAKKEAKAEGDKKSAKAIQKLIDRAERQPWWDKSLDAAYPVFVGWWRD